MKRTVKQWVDLLDLAGVTREDLEPGPENHTERIIMSHIGGPAVVTTPYCLVGSFLIVIPEGWEAPTEAEWLAIERAFGVKRDPAMVAWLR